MNYQDDFRNRELVLGLAGELKRLVAGSSRTLTFMEVCGTHTMAIYQFGLRGLLPPQVRLISGPGCPVCVTPVGYVDQAVAYSNQPDTIVATFGDMVRVPGSSSSLLAERAKGADIRIVYSPLDAVGLAAANPGKRVIFLGVGFETTAPTIAGSILTASAKGLDNYFVLTAHKTMPAPMRVLSADPELALDGYLCPAHVSAIVGADTYRFLADEFGLACVVTGFEPADVLQGVIMLVRQVLAGESRVEIQYSRVVSWEGNRKALSVMGEVLTPCDADWRGIGTIPGSGLAINDRYASFDPLRVMPVKVEPPREPSGCCCGEILKGKIAPLDCPLFGTVCTPEEPVGACMVSSEGTCAAAYKYGQ